MNSPPLYRRTISLITPGWSLRRRLLSGLSLAVSVIDPSCVARNFRTSRVSSPGVRGVIADLSEGVRYRLSNVHWPVETGE